MPSPPMRMMDSKKGGITPSDPTTAGGGASASSYIGAADIESSHGGDIVVVAASTPLLIPGGGSSSSCSSFPSKSCPSGSSSSMIPSADTIKILGLFAMWYIFNVLYNIDNKHALLMLPLPWTVSCIQLFVGWLFFLSLWLTGLRPRPSFHSWEIFSTKMIPQGICHLFVHIGAVISMKAGAVSFTHIVKAAEPVLTAGLSGVLLGQFFAWQTYFSLVPVVLGVGVASVTELSFTWMSFWCAMLSNLGSSLRSILAKQTMMDKKEVGENLTSANIYSVLTIIASLACLPMAIVMEGGILLGTWEQVTTSSPTLPSVVVEEGFTPPVTFTSAQIFTKILMSGLWYYMYNEVAFGALECVHQLTHAVANTLKRVVIIVITVVVFRNPVTLLGSVGSAIAIGGTLLYSLAKSKFG